MTRTPLLFAVALDGAGWHPAAWREADARPDRLTTPGYWTALVVAAERGGVDFVTIEDSMTIQTTDPHRVRGRMDAVQVAARVAPATSHIGLVPTVTVTHTEPFHTSRAIATLDLISRGRAGWSPRTAALHETALFGRRGAASVEESLTEAADYVEVVRELWDSWEDDAVIQDGATGRFVDADRLHHIDFHGRWFDVKGPSVVARPPQGQPLVCVCAPDDDGVRLAARTADVVFATPADRTRARQVVDRVRAAQGDASRENEEIHVFADLTVFLDVEPGRARERRSRLDDLGGPCPTDAKTVAGTPAELADLMHEWRTVGLAGFRLRPAALPHDLDQICGPLVAELRRRGMFPNARPAENLRGRLGLPRPGSRYTRGGTT